MSVFQTTANVLKIAQAGLPAVLTDALFKQIANLMYVKTSIGGYFFDAVFRTEHSTHLNITSHPVQGGANISDHCFMEPAKLSIELGMSDVSSSLVFGQFAGGPSKSQDAFTALKLMQAKRQPIDVSTRLETYKNMLIEDLSFPDDLKTNSGLRAMVSLRQVIIVDVAKVSKVSARPQVTNSTAAGNVVTVKPNQSILKKYNIVP